MESLLLLALLGPANFKIPPPAHTASQTLKLNDDVQACWGTSQDTCIEHDTAVTPDTAVIGVGAESRNLIVCEKADIGTDWAKAQQTNPTLCVQSADATTTTDRVCIAHNQTDGVISTDGGDLYATPAGADFFVGTNANGPWMKDAAASGTVATMGPDRAVPGSGWGYTGGCLTVVQGSAAYSQYCSSQVLVSSTIDLVPRGGLVSDVGDMTVEDTFAVQGNVIAKGQKTLCTVNAETLTFAANPGDASKVTSTLVPDGAVVSLITTRVLTAGTNCTSIDIGDGTDVDMFADNSSVADTTTTNGAQVTDATRLGALATSAWNVTVTGVGGNCFDLSIRIEAHYCTGVASTSD